MFKNPLIISMNVVSESTPSLPTSDNQKSQSTQAESPEHNQKHQAKTPSTKHSSPRGSIISNSSSAQKVEEYQDQILAFLRIKETQYSKSVDFLSVQREINSKMRAILIDWIIDITVKFKTQQKTLYLTIDIIDRYLSLKSVKKSEFQLLGIASLMVACKIEEIYPPLLKDYVYICDYAFSKEQILEMEGEILYEIGFDFAQSCYYDFLEFFQEKLRMDKKVYFFIQYILEMSLLDVKCAKYKGIEMVVGAIFLVRKIFKTGDWDEELKEMCDLNDKVVKLCARDLFLSLQKVDSSDFTSVKRKYAEEEFCEVSKFKIQQGK